MNDPRNAAEAVANGAQLLDDHHPGWWRMIDLDNLNINSCTRCVCGQLATAIGMPLRQGKYGPHSAYLEMRNSLGLSHGCYHGFAPRSTEVRVNDLENEWHKVITARLEADALTSAEKKEKVLAHV